MKMMILCYCHGIRTRKFDISRSYQPFVYNDFAVWRFHSQDVVVDVQSRGLVAEEELQLLNKPNPVSTPRGRESVSESRLCPESSPRRITSEQDQVPFRTEDPEHQVMLDGGFVDSFWDSRKYYKR